MSSDLTYDHAAITKRINDSIDKEGWYIENALLCPPKDSVMAKNTWAMIAKPFAYYDRETKKMYIISIPHWFPLNAVNPVSCKCKNLDRHLDFLSKTQSIPQ